MVMIKHEALETNMSLYPEVCTDREVLSRPDYRITRDIRKESKLFTGQATGERGVKLKDISKLPGYNQDIVAWNIAIFPELAVLGLMLVS